MSHVAMAETKPGQPMFKDMQALKMACDMLGLEVMMKKDYTWWGHHVGDYPKPPGVKEADLGKNAVFVIGPNEENRKKYPGCYEVGMVEDPQNEGCFVPIYDFYGGGKGIDNLVGKALFNDPYQKNVKMLCPRLKQTYDMCCDKLAAIAVGDNIEFLTAKQAHQKYPALFPATEDELTWVSIADTSNRVQETAPLVY